MACRARRALLCGLLIVTGTIYAPTLRHGFVYEDVNWMDDLDRPTAIAIPGRSLTLSTHQAIYAVVGYDARWFHAGNVALHLLNGVLVYAVMGFLAPAGVALLSAAVFLLYPLNSSAVAYATGRSDLLMACCTLLAVWCALKGRWWVLGAVVAMLAAAMSKEIGVMAVGLVALTLLLFRRGTWEFRYLASGAAIGLGAVCGHAYALIANWLSNNPTLGGSPLPWAEYAVLQMTAFWHLLAVWPFGGFSIDHDIVGLSVQWQLVSVLLTIQLVALVALTWRRQPRIAWALGWMGLAIGPRFLVRTSEFLTEPQMYLPMVGVSVLLGLGVARLPVRWPLSQKAMVYG